ncbi:hypothetical protein [Halomontanus rarus]|uniref:hypothetical protein n=1 Tax=Halomontanus rarus TaxID=3034020 RepID=UPI00307C5D69
MKLEHTGPVVSNGPGASVYLGEDFLEHPSFPFRPGDDEFRALFSHESDAIVLLPTDRDLEFPLSLTVYDPESYRLTIDPDPDTDTMHTDPPDTDHSERGIDR